MGNSDKQPDTSGNSKIVSDIVGYLKNYPFLLISVAGLVVFIGALPLLEGEKLNAFKWLIYIFLLAPILLQFFLVYKKAAARKAENLVAAPEPSHAHQVVETHETAHSRHFSRKAIFSLLLVVLNVLAYNGPLDKSAHLGAIILLGIPALMLGFSAFNDAQHGEVSGKGLAITSTVLAVLMILISLGGMLGGGESVPAATPATITAVPSDTGKQVNAPPLPEPEPAQSGIARVCVTQYGACPMAVVLPVGSACTCTGQYGVFPGIAQ